MNQLFDFQKQLDALGEYGVVTQVHHPLVVVQGLSGVHLREIVVFEVKDDAGNAYSHLGEVFILHENSCEILVYANVPAEVGVRVARTGQFVSVPVSEKLLGAVIDPLGNLKSGGVGVVEASQRRPIDSDPPGIPSRVRIQTPFLTGVAIVDMMVPLGRGQKELIIGDRKTGKSSFIFATIKNQVAYHNAIAIYAACGKKKSDIRRVEHFFAKEGISDRTVIVAADSDDSPSLIYLTPYAAMTIAEYFRDLGRDVLVVFDDLSTHARYYREVSLLAKRFPGRESYPGDIFYTHARLLERCGNFKHKGGGEVSITALPIAELVNGDFAGYIPTNLMGMTDGHIYFDANQYFEGRRPAVNISLSVTRVGKQATSSLVRSINREVTAFLVLYEKMQNLSHFGAELTPTVKHVLETGEMIYVFFQQPYTENMPQAVQIVLFSMIWLKFFDISVKDRIGEFGMNLVEAYSDPEVQAVLDNLTKAETLNAMLGEVAKQKDYLTQICTTNARSKKK